MAKLQREDGSYIGADKEGNLFAIGADGSVVWQQQLGAGALTPLYATADGGAIVTTTTPPCQPFWVVAPFGTPPCPLGSQSQAQLGTLYTVDQNGNVTSQTPDAGDILSWSDQWYDSAPSSTTVSALALAAPDWGYGAAAFGGGNPDKTSAYTNECPKLPQAANDQIEQAYSDLHGFLLHTTCPFCITNIFQPLKTSQAEFTTYLGQDHLFCDGTTSKMPGSKVGAPEKTVADYFAHHNIPDQDMADAVSVPSVVHNYQRSRQTTLFRPASILSFSDQRNEAMLFHEFLHGATGYGDGRTPGGSPTGLCDLLGNPVLGVQYPDCVLNTVRITNWIDDKVFGGK